MRQQNNGRRRQNRGSNRRNFNNGNLNGNINKNTVIDSSGPDGRQRGSVAQLNEKYTSLASDASSSDDRILAESFLQFADHYYRLQKEIELNTENKENKIKPEFTNTSNNSSIIAIDDNEKTTKTPSRRKRGFQMREAELSTLENNEESNEVKEIKPTIFSGVPRLFENIFKKIKSQINKVGFFKRLILNICFNGLEYSQQNKLRKYLSQIFIFLFLRTTVRKIFGGKVKALISGGAALSPQIGLFFNKIGLTLLQGYGQTEAAPLISCNTKKFNNPNTVGFPVKNVEIKIAVDGEILVKGSNVMNGYWRSKKLTSQTIKKEWLYTGDLGFLDKMGRLVINGRKKDLIVTSGGDNISVQKIETKLSEQVEIEQAVVFGDNKPFLIALLVVQDSSNKSKYTELIKKINTSLNSLERIRKFLLLKEKFTYEL